MCVGQGVDVEVMELGVCWLENPFNSYILDIEPFWKDTKCLERIEVILLGIISQDGEVPT